MRHIKITHKGIGLLELMLVMIVIASISLLATRYYITTREKARVASAIDMVNTVANASYQWVTQNSNFTGISMEALAAINYQPYGDGTGKTPWQGDIAVQSDNTGANAVLTIDKLASTNCTALLNALNKYLHNSSNSCTGDTASQTLTIYLPAP